MGQFLRIIRQGLIRVLGQSLSGLPSKFNFNWSSLLPSVSTYWMQVNALFHILFAPHLGLLPGLAAHFCFSFLLRHGVRYMAHALSLLRWQLYAYKTRHAFVLSQGHTANSVTSIFGSLQFEFSSMVYFSTLVHV